MLSTDVLVVGGGITGLALADRLRQTGARSATVVEAADELGGYCRTVRRDGFVWDYAGHYFHFRDDALRTELIRRLGSDRVRHVVRRAKVAYRGRFVDYPFQHHIDQLDPDDHLRARAGLIEAANRAPGRPVTSFADMLVDCYGSGIAELFLQPYNEKLFATDLKALDVQAMGRFFPGGDARQILDGIGRHDGVGYNATFTYPIHGASAYVDELARDLDPRRVLVEEPVVAIDPARRVARTTRREIGYERLVSTIALPRLLDLLAWTFPRRSYTHNSVLVLNLGFDRASVNDAHWIYVPDPSISFYRVGNYSAIHSADRMSLYLEIGLPGAATLSEVDVARWRRRALADLRRLGLVTDHRLVAHHSVVLSPAYVHVTPAALDDVPRQLARLSTVGIESIGRYGSWTYCSIEDNIVQARACADAMSAPADRAAVPPVAPRSR